MFFVLFVVFLMETGTSKYPSICSSSVALLDCGFGVSEEQATSISATFWLSYFLPKCLTLAAVPSRHGDMLHWL